MNTQPTCPDRSALERLLAGSPTDPPAEALYAHIEQCGACVRTLFDLGHGDTLPDLVRSGAAVAAVDPTAVEPLIRRILDRGEAADVTVTTPDGRDTGNETADALAVLSPPQAAGEIGRLGGYRVQKVLGQGGMGAGSIAAFSAYLHALKHLPVATVSLYAYVNPVIAVALGTILLGEPFSPRLALAGAIVLLGMMLVRRG